MNNLLEDLAKILKLSKESTILVDSAENMVTRQKERDKQEIIKLIEKQRRKTKNETEKDKNEILFEKYGEFDIDYFNQQ